MIKEIEIEIENIILLKNFQLLSVKKVGNKILATVLDLGTTTIEEFKNNVLNSNIPVCITNDLELIQFVNYAWEKETGYTLQEVVGHKPNILQGSKTSKVVKYEIKKKIHTKKIWEGVITNYRKNGEEFTKFLHIFPFNEFNWIGVFVTIDKDLEENFQKLNELEEKISDFYKINLS